MFDLFRSRATAVRIMLGGLMLLVALSMVTYLIPGSGLGTTGGESQIVANVGDRAVTLNDLQQAIKGQMRNQELPPEVTATLIPQFADSLITQYAVAYQAERLGFRVSEADLAAEIKRILPQLFQGNSYAGDQAYAAALSELNMTIPQFEAALTQQVLLNDLQGLAGEGVVVTQPELEAAFRRMNDKVKIEFVAVSPGQVASQISIKPEEIKEYYDKNRAAFQVSEKRSMEVLVIDQTKVSQSIAVSDEDLRRLYDQNKDNFRVPDRVSVRHILLKTTDVPKEEAAKLKTKAEGLLQQLKQGADFADLAKKNSEDPGSAAKGGELGWIVRGQTVKAFEDAAFSLKPKDLSNVITTEYGFHILQVLEKEQARLKTFEDVKTQLADERKKQAVFDRMQELSDQARAALAKDPKGADKIAAGLGLQLVRLNKVGSDDFNPEIGVSSEFQNAVSAARKGEVLSVAVNPTRMAVVVVTDVFPAHPADLTEAERPIREKLGTQKLGQLIDARVNEVLEKAKSLNGDLKKTAQQSGLELKTPPEFTRDGSVEGLGGANYVDQAFTAPVGQVFVSQKVNEQRFICRVVARTPADMSQLVAQRDTLLRQVKNTKARERLEILREGIRDQLIKEGKIKIHQDVINRLVSSYRGS
jgi:peptidyl-prolyl cis-trans isomerase D